MKRRNLNHCALLEKRGAGCKIAPRPASNYYIHQFSVSVAILRTQLCKPARYRYIALLQFVYAPLERLGLLHLLVCQPLIFLGALGVLRARTPFNGYLPFVVRKFAPEFGYLFLCTLTNIFYPSLIILGIFQGRARALPYHYTRLSMLGQAPFF